MPCLLYHLFLNKTDKFSKAPSFSGLRMWALPTQHKKKRLLTVEGRLSTPPYGRQILRVTFNAFNVLKGLVLVYFNGLEDLMDQRLT